MKSMLVLASLVVVLANSAIADIALTTTPGLSFLPNSGNQTFQLLGTRDSLDGPIQALIGTVQLGVPFGQGSFVGPTPVNWSTNFASGQLDPGSTSQVGPPDPRFSLFSLAYGSNVLLPTSPAAVLGTFTFNVDGLSPGFYPLAFSSLASDGPSVVASSGQGFTITAVPEPGSILTAALLGFGGMFYRRRRSTRA